MSGAADPRSRDVFIVGMSDEEDIKMTLNGIPCSCGGSNAHCFRCFGTGVKEPAPSTKGWSAGPATRRLALSPCRHHFTRCSVCGVAIRTSRLKRHATRCPGRTTRVSRPQRRRSQQRRSPKRSAFWVTKRRIVQTLDDALGRRDRRDATRDYYWFRENGRWGSHPAHDGFDDESGPL